MEGLYLSFPLRWDEAIGPQATRGGKGWLHLTRQLTVLHGGKSGWTLRREPGAETMDRLRGCLLVHSQARV